MPYAVSVSPHGILVFVRLFTCLCHGTDNDPWTVRKMALNWIMRKVHTTLPEKKPESLGVQVLKVNEARNKAIQSIAHDPGQFLAPVKAPVVESG